MAVCPHLRGALLAGLLATGLCFALCSPARAEGVAWLTDRSAAFREAQKHGKLLLVVHISSDFTASPLQSDALTLYETNALADPRVAALLRTRYVVLAASVGETASLRLPRTDKAAAQEAAVAYICLPDERVLHFVPGFPSPNEVLKELQWAEQCYAELAELPAAEQPRAARRAHRAMLAGGDVANFERRFSSRWLYAPTDAGSTTVGLPRVVAAAREVFQSALANRLGPSWQREALPPLAAHAGLAAELAHFILAEYPLSALSDLSGPVYAAATGRRQFMLPKRRAELAEWWARVAKAGRPTLLVVDDDYFAALGRDYFDAPNYRWPPDNALAIPHLARFATQPVTLDELSLLIADAKLPEVCYSGERPLRFLVHDVHGFRLAELTGLAATHSKLAEVLKNH